MTNKIDDVDMYEDYPIGSKWLIEHDDFNGKVIGYYTTDEGKQGVVMQQLGTRVVHVYGIKWLTNPSA